uniref:Photosystem I reaction center subunit III n=1 Tax=Characiopsis acuta TaxID=2040456 RepID=A0A3R5U8P3_9STRA|nr:photosystem I reaction center subunit III [Characiopsis acuta]QAA11273.1 photosystem I reaction center subunit III [Characiopsis acuta]
MTKFVKFASIALLNSLTLPLLANADVGGLNPCKDSEVFQKRLAKTVKKLEFRLKKYEESSPPRLAIQDQITRTKQRFERYGNSNLLCGNDGLPHLVADGRWSHAAEFVAPGILFIHIAGWIGWVGRKYIRTVSESSNPTEKEIIIDVPLALSIMTTGFLWPFAAWQEYLSGDLLASDDTITTSPK